MWLSINALGLIQFKFLFSPNPQKQIYIVDFYALLYAFLSTPLYHILENSLKLLHPFMPFVTEEIWGMLPVESMENKKLLMVEKWPFESAFGKPYDK